MIVIAFDTYRYVRKLKNRFRGKSELMFFATPKQNRRPKELELSEA
jgi:predicted ATP-dependent serine protease